MVSGFQLFSEALSDSGEWRGDDARGGMVRRTRSEIFQNEAMVDKCIV